MVVMMLLINAELENLIDLQPQGGCDDPNFAYYFKLKCGNCGEMSPKETCLIMSETVPLPNSRGAETNLVQKCKFCGRDGSITMIPGRGKPLVADEDDNTSFTPLMLFECRGSLEPVDFSFGRGWRATSIYGTVFEHIDLSGGEFADYCEKRGGAPVMITNPKYKLQIVK